MPMTLEEFRKLNSVPAKSSVKGGRKCDWSEVQAAITGKAWGVKEVHDIALACSGDRGISRTRVMRWLDDLVKKGIAMKHIDGVKHVYWINDTQTSTPVAKRSKSSNSIKQRD